MILIPFGFTGSSGGVAPVNSVAPLVIVVNADTREISYEAGTWANADTVDFAWFMNNIEQVGETGTTFFAEFGLDVKVVETATNGFGSTILDSNIVNITAPPYVDSGLVTWALQGSSMDSVLPAALDEGLVSWTFEGDYTDSYADSPIEYGEINWEVFGSVV